MTPQAIHDFSVRSQRSSTFLVTTTQGNREGHIWAPPPKPPDRLHIPIHVHHL
ncbi:hypothetical protein M430DRAFT_33650 [Amorphotheca resinae ATCC 22711]|uniref:Uncharacterized protein n=1 Tax=Amorphotheca resinae ATCC 22711 TaxID=857342 RepID=A0A2T3B831_AMORE|nr:hypothetical protein M430DRAFT_33650 [Amorphotheca resinae ATCC 22711]PSS23029.1 hypothetical protein M430DRAFT_33650 [Amorphotheca resinae ATCC 22711]